MKSHADSPRPAHPRLYFTADELPSLRARATGTHADIWAQLQTYCEEHVAEAPPDRLPGDEYNARGLYLEAEFLSRITNFSLSYLLSGEARYAAAAKAWLMALARMPEWAGRCGNRPDAGLYAGLGEMALAIGYDWLHEQLTPEERAVVRAKLEAVAATLEEATREGEWWTGAYWHHDLIIPVAGLGVGAVALRGETPEASGWLARAVGETEAVLARIGDDGAWHEGAAPWAFGTMTLLMFLDALERETGRSFWSHPWLQATADYRLYVWLPPDQVVNFDDCHTSGGYSTLTRDCAPILYRLASQYQHPYAQWLGDLDAAAKQNADSLAWRFLWRSSAIEPRPPTDLPLSRGFANQDLVIARAGWEEGDPVLAFTCGATLGRSALPFAVRPDGSADVGANAGSDHTHADQLSIMVYAGGDYLISPLGYGRREAPDQNSILVDGRGPRRYADSDEPIRDAGRVQELLLTPYLDVMIGEAADCYPPELGVLRATRQITFAKPDVILLSDRVSLRAPLPLEWRFHGGRGVEIQRMSDGFRFQGRRASLRITMLAPMGVDASIEKDQRHEWLSLRWPEPVAEAALRMVMTIESGAPRDGGHHDEEGPS